MANPDNTSGQSAQLPDVSPIVSRPTQRPSSCSVRSLQVITTVLANIAVILGLAFAAGQIVESRAQERVRIAVDATTVVYSPQFLSAYMNVIEGNRRGTEIPRDDLIFVTNIYDSIAILYLRGVADGAIIRSRIGTNVPELLSVLYQEKWPEPTTQNLQRMAHELKLPLQPHPITKP